jgi:hypothetical protein
MTTSVLGLSMTLKLCIPNSRETTSGTSGSISTTVSSSTAGSMLTAPAVTPAPHPITITERACVGTSVVRWPSIRWRRMSCGSLEACTFPALW